MTATELLHELKPLGKANYKRILMENHGVQEPVFGVPISELKKFEKQHRRNHQLALDLYATGNYDAMYLAGLIADDTKMTKKDLQQWVDAAPGGAIHGSTVPWVAAGSNYGREVALKWIEDKKPSTASAGWFTWCNLVALKEDDALDLAEIKRLIQRVKKEIHEAPDMVRYAMNSFVICVGSYVKPLSGFALETAESIGPVEADLGDNHCQIPFAPDYIRKVAARGSIGKKRKTVKC
jgi:3-methyladenine DNA glycosylase AlkD